MVGRGDSPYFYGPFRFLEKHQYVFFMIIARYGACWIGVGLQIFFTSVSGIQDRVYSDPEYLSLDSQTHISDNFLGKKY
jgi:hypothetical protein